MIFAATIRDLWRLLDSRGKVTAMGLVVLLSLVSAMEMAGVLFLFGYIAALSPQAPGEAGAFFRAVAGGSGASFAATAGLIMLAIFAVKNLASLLANFFLLRFSMKRCEQVSARLFCHFQRLPLERLNKMGTLEPLRIIETTRNVFRNGFNPALLALSDVALIAALMITAAVVLDLWLAFLSGAVIGTAGIVFLHLTRRLSSELGERERSAERIIRRVSAEAFRGIIELRLAGLQGRMMGRYRSGLGEFALADRRVRILEQVPRALNEILLAAGIVLAAVYFALSGDGLQSALPVLAALGFIGLRVTSAMARLTSTMQQIRSLDIARRELMETVQHLELEKTPVKRPDGKVLPLDCAIVLDNVSYRYAGGELPAVDGISLELPKGSFTGICGLSGSGKSTVALMIMGLLRPTSGEILCDGRPVADDPEGWHAQVGFVSQTPFIAGRDVRENVAFGLEGGEIDDDNVWRCLGLAALAPVIRARPEGLSAQLGEEGVMLSGGERQRLAIARALYRDPQVLVFDEATAALNSVTEREVTEAIKSLSGQRTIVCVAHRLSTIRDSDIIFVMEKGRVVASGRYGELMDGSDAFRRLAQGEEEAI